MKISDCLHHVTIAQWSEHWRPEALGSILVETVSAIVEIYILIDVIRLIESDVDRVVGKETDNLISAQCLWLLLMRCYELTYLHQLQRYSNETTSLPNQENYNDYTQLGIET